MINGNENVPGNENRLQRYDINKHRPRYGHKCTKYKMCLSMYIYSNINHCVKSVQIRSFFWPVFSYIRTEYRDLRSKSPYSIRIQENSEHVLSNI